MVKGKAQNLSTGKVRQSPKKNDLIPDKEGAIPIVNLDQQQLGILLNKMEALTIDIQNL